MAGVDYAEKYSSKVQERFKLKSVTAAGVNKDYDWLGVSAINVYEIPTVAMGNYTLTGDNRYGSPVELDVEAQTLLLSKDRAFPITIDGRTLDDTQKAVTAGQVLRRQIDEVIIPEIDIYRIGVIATAAQSAGGINGTLAASTNSTAYINFLAGAEYLGNNKVPVNKRVAWVSYGFYSLIKQDGSFMKASEMSKKELVNGVVGMVDGIKIIPVPSSYLPANTEFVMAHPSVTVAAEKLTSYKIHTNPVGLHGVRIEGRVRYDAFVLQAKNKGIYVRKSA